jgi:hypothetical protein
VRLALALLLAAATPAWAQVFKCVDERGITHYADKPRPGCKGGPVDIRPIPSITGSQLKPRPAPDLARQEADFRRRQIEREHSAAKARATHDERCAKLREEHATLASGIRLYEIDVRLGERVFIEDANRDTRLAQLKGELRTCH